MIIVREGVYCNINEKYALLVYSTYNISNKRKKDNNEMLSLC